MNILKHTHTASTLFNVSSARNPQSLARQIEKSTGGSMKMSLDRTLE